MIEPIKPSEIEESLHEAIPASVIKAINDCLKESYRGGPEPVRLKQKDIISRIIKYDPRLDRDTILGKRYMDFEQLYSQYGWSVHYDKPGLDEPQYDPVFEFRPVPR
jgi:hypothetical protein